MAACPECLGSGRVPGVSEAGLSCLSCDGTGDYLAAVAWRAYRRGWSDGIDAMRAAMPGGDGPPMSVVALLAEVRRAKDDE